MESAQQLLLNLENNFISLFQLLLLKRHTFELSMLPSLALWELNLPKKCLESD